MNKKNILVVASHPDDEILGCGGSIDKYSKLGYKIYTLILGSGIDSRNLKKNTLKDKKILNSQCIKANRTLGVKNIFFENLSDNSFDNYNLLKIVKIIESYLKKIKPIIVFTHNKKDLKSSNCYIITVPTPIDKSKKPDLRPLLNASKLIGEIINLGDLIIYESTVYPGCVEEVCVPALEKYSQLIKNKKDNNTISDFFKLKIIFYLE